MNKPTEYLGIKRIVAWPMSLGEYNEYREWEIPEKENPEDKGYLVEYFDSPGSVHPDHKNYISWSPKSVFDKAYRLITGLTFGMAIEAMKKGEKVARYGWNGKEMWIMMVEGKTLAGVSDSKFSNPDGNLVISSHIDMFSADKKQVVGWLASQTDMLAEDWTIVE